MTSNDSEKERILDHSYDGIQEFDNPLPRWWVWIFWATIVFSVLYVFDFTGRIKGPGRIAQYESEVAAAALRWPASELALGVDSATLATLVSDAAVLAAGKTVYQTNCAVCHRDDGGGLIGPNLTDEFWLHGASLVAIRKTVAGGVLEKGMPPWGKILKPDQLDAVTAYVSTLAGTNPPNPKEPQGEKVAKAESAAVPGERGAR